MRVRAALLYVTTSCAAAASLGTALLPPEGEQDGPIRPVQLLHIPKSGSTFANTLYRHACQGIPPDVGIDGNVAPIQPLSTSFPPQQFCPNGWVDPTSLDGHPPALIWKPNYRGRYAGMLRQPTDIKLSFLNFMAEIALGEGCAQGDRVCVADSTRAEASLKIFLDSIMIDDGKNVDEITRLATKAVMSREAPGTVSAFSEDRCTYLRTIMPRLRGGQTKMTVQGLPFLALPSDPSPTPGSTNPMLINGPSDLKNQLGLTDQVPQGMPSGPAYLFLGSTERWNTSICLFHAVARSDMTSNDGMPQRVQFASSRAGTERIDWRAEMERCFEGDASWLTRDPMDDELYKLMKDRFDAQMADVLAREAAMPPGQGRIYENCMRVNSEF